MALTVGIDLGTTYSVISYIDPQSKKAVILPNRFKNKTTPSAVGFNPDGTYVIGEAAKSMEEGGDPNVASFYKLHMGDPNYKYTYYGKEYTACDLSSLFMKRMIEEAEVVAGDKIKDAVITVPAYFVDAQRNDTIKAGKAAGLNVLNIISEPTAACVAYGLNDESVSQKILIYDLGGGTFDVTIAEIQAENIKVLATNGHHQLGGRDWDSALVEWMNQKFYDETGVDITEDAEAAAANMIKAEKAKIQLTTSKSTDFVITDGYQKIKVTLTRDEFEDITSYQLDATTDLIDKMFAEKGLGWSDINGAVLVGGSTKMPMVRNYISGHGVNILEGVHPDEAVAIGAAIQANISSYCALAPADKKKSSMEITLTSGKKALNLASLPGAKVIQDVISHSLGMIMVSQDETKFVNDIMIKRNTSYEDAHETKERELRVSRKKENNKLDIYLLQGESESPINCSVAKKYVFTGIDYVDGGRSIISITYNHTFNGTIAVSAVQKETGKALIIHDEPIPEDMSWVTRPPKEVFAEQGGSSEPGVIVMALDASGSMSGSIRMAKSAMHDFAKQFNGTGISIGIVAFGSSVADVCDPTSDMRKVDKAIDALEVGKVGFNAPKNGGMNIGCGTRGPMDEVYDMLRRCKNDSFKYAVILTDGAWDSESRAFDAKRKYEASEYEIVCLGFGGANDSFLKRLSTRADLAGFDDISNLSSNLSSIARVINN